MHEYADRRLGRRSVFAILGSNTFVFSLFLLYCDLDSSLLPVIGLLGNRSRTNPNSGDDAIFIYRCKVVKDVFGKSAVIPRCKVHKKRNVLAHLPESEQARVSVALAMAYREFEYGKAKSALELLLKDLSYRYPKAADSLREGLKEPLTVHRLKLPGLLRKRLTRPTRWSRPIPGT